MVMALCLYTLNRFILKRTISNTTIIGYFLHCYLNDCIGGFCIICYINIILLNSKYDSIHIHSFFLIVIITLICGLLWEYVFPAIHHRGISDAWDVGAYLLGGILYYYINRIIMKYYNRQKWETHLHLTTINKS